MKTVLLVAWVVFGIPALAYLDMKWMRAVVRSSKGGQT